MARAIEFQMCAGQIVASIYLLGFILSHDHTYALAHVMLLVKPNAFHSFFNELIIFRFQAHGPGSLNPFTRASSACRSKTPIGEDLSYGPEIQGIKLDQRCLKGFSMVPAPPTTDYTFYSINIASFTDERLCNDRRHLSMIW